MNEIHPTAIIDNNVILGKGNKILPYTIIHGPTEIGDYNQIGPHAVIGTPGQNTRDPYYDSSESRIEIGSRNIIREFCGVHKPCYTEITWIGNDIFLMQGVQISHDAKVYDKVVVAPICGLSGIATLLTGASLGISSSVNQYCIVGHYAFVAANAPVTRNVKPFSRYIPNKLVSVNEYAIKKFGFEKYQNEIAAYVLHNQEPVSGIIADIVSEFNQIHKLSGKELY
nr:hypothetical protein [Bacteroidota bacterium]